VGLDHERRTWLFEAVIRPSLQKIGQLLVLCTLLLGFPALARAEMQGPRQQTLLLIAELEKHTEQRALVDGPLQRSRSALNRAAQAKQLGRQEQSAVLERVALSWAQLGQLLLKTAALEAEASKLETLQNDLDIRIKRARALLEETLARRARAQETLKKLEQPSATKLPEKP